MGALHDDWKKFKSAYPEWLKLRKSDLNLGKTLDEIDKLCQSISEQADKLNAMAEDLIVKGNAGHKKLLEVMLAYRQVITASALANKDAAAKALDAFRDKASRFSGWPQVAAKHLKETTSKIKPK